MSLEKTVEFFKAKGIGISVFGDVHKLHAGASGADGGIQRRCVDGNQKHVDPKVCSTGDIFIKKLPVCFRKNIHMMLGGDTVCVKPSGIEQFLLRYLYRQDIQQHGFGKGIHRLRLQ